MLQPAEGCDHLVSIQHLNQPVKQALLVVWPRLKIFLEDTLSIADGLKHRLLIGHDVISGRWEILRSTSWPSALCSIGFRSSAIRWKLVKRLLRIRLPVRPGNRDVSIAVFCQFRCLFKGGSDGFAPQRDAAANIRR